MVIIIIIKCWIPSAMLIFAIVKIIKLQQQTKKVNLTMVNFN